MLSHLMGSIFNLLCPQAPIPSTLLNFNYPSALSCFLTEWILLITLPGLAPFDAVFALPEGAAAQGHWIDLC